MIGIVGSTINTAGRVETPMGELEGFVKGFIDHGSWFIVFGRWLMANGRVHSSGKFTSSRVHKLCCHPVRGTMIEG